ncbi:MAG: radical SAM protein [Theionarchaea archaeon]|nr:radical SAM protein [Theionarchaea archaeon]
MKVLLLHTPTRPKCPPFPFMYVATLLRQAGISFDAIDLNGYVSNEEMATDPRSSINAPFPLRPPESVIDACRIDVGKDRYDLAIVYGYYTNYNFTHRLVLALKEVQPHLRIVVEGTWDNLAAEVMLHTWPIDAVIHVEPEFCAVQVVTQLVSEGDLRDIPNVSFRANGSVVHNPRVFPDSLDQLPLPAYDLIPQVGYAKERIATLKLLEYMKKTGYPGDVYWIISSRGCPYHCIFCHNAHMFCNTWRCRSAENTVDEMELARSQGRKFIGFHDEFFTYDMDRAFKICDEILERGLDVEWTCITRPDYVTPELISKMREAGCYSMFYGVECASQKVLDACRKHIKLEDIETAITLTRDAGMTIRTGLIVGLPKQTLKEIDDTIDFVRRMELEMVNVTALTCYPDSPAWKEGDQLGIRPLGRWWENSDSLSGKPSLETDWMSYKEILEAILYLAASIEDVLL